MSGSCVQGPGIFPENSTRRLTAARQRWKILAQALVGSMKSSDTCQNGISVRRFQCFGLFATGSCGQSQQQEDGSGATWLQYTCPDFTHLSLAIRHLPGTVDVKTLLGFNNTGNICIWPSEEVMAYYCLKNLHCFRKKSVIELGGGMTCLAGLAVAAGCAASRVVLTDGNEESVHNLNLIIKENEGISSDTVTSSVLRWGPEGIAPHLAGEFDFVICADCLFFEDGRIELMNYVFDLLRPQGQAIMFAPHRGNTLQSFVELARTKFFVTVKDNYDDKIWALHQELKNKGDNQYDDNIHYPLFLLLEKMPTT